jgi:hypothetical protein
MSAEKRNTIAVVVCVSEFARAANLSQQEAFRYLNSHGGIDFSIEFYDVEHTLSMDDTIEDLKEITRKAGGRIA